MKHADTNFIAIKPEMLDEFLALDTASEQKDFQRTRGVDYAIFL